MSTLSNRKSPKETVWITTTESAGRGVPGDGIYGK